MQEKADDVKAQIKLKLTKGQLISKANFELSFKPIERKYFCISALAL